MSCDIAKTKAKSFLDNILVYHTGTNKSSKFVRNLPPKYAYDRRSFLKGRLVMANTEQQSFEALIADWLTVEGDLDDFIFYSENEQVSEK